MDLTVNRQSQLPIHVQLKAQLTHLIQAGQLVKDLERSFHQSPGFLQRYPLVVTTLWHIHGVQKLHRKAKIEVVGLMAGASVETLMRLMALPEGTKVGVACHEWTGSQNVKPSIENAGLRNIQFVMGCGAEPESLERILKEARVVVCSGLVDGKIRALAPKGTEIIVDNRTLDKGGMEMLRQRLAQLAGGVENRGARRARR